MPVQWRPFVLLSCEARRRKRVCCDSSASPWIPAESRRQQGLHLLLPVRQLRLREAKSLWQGYTVARSHRPPWNERRAEHRASGSRTSLPGLEVWKSPCPLCAVFRIVWYHGLPCAGPLPIFRIVWYHGTCCWNLPNLLLALWASVS